MSDGQLIFLFLLGCCALAFSTAWLLRARRREWSRRRIALVAALPVPALLAVPLLIVGLANLYDLLLHPEHCGVDACAMLTAMVVVSLGWDLLACLASLFAALLAMRLRR